MVDFRALRPTSVVARRALAAAVAAVIAAGPASAQIEEIVVTATKREESLQGVASAITAFTANEIERQRITRPADFIALTPGVVLSDSNHPGESLITIRGDAQTRNTEAPVAVVIDGVVLTGRTQFNGELFDLQQIEVLKGPQGYLYGRNAIAGAIVITTKKPENEWGGSITAGYGSQDHKRLRGSFGGALIEDELYFRFSGAYRDRDGFYQNVTRNEKIDPYEEKIGRVRLLWEPSDSGFSADLRLLTSDVDAASTMFSPQTAIAPIQTSPQAAILDINRVEEIPFVRNVESVAAQDKDSIALKLDYAADYGTFTSVTTYDDVLDVFSTDDFPYFSSPDTTQFNVVSHEAVSQELRFTSPADERFRYIVGAYFVDIENSPNVHAALGLDPGGFTLPAFRPRPPGDPNETVSFISDNVDTEAWAAFFQLSYDISDTLELTVAGRLDDEDKESVDNAPPQFSATSGQIRKQNFSEFQPKINLAWRPNENLTVYGGYAKGFQAGGFNGAQTLDRTGGAVPNEFPESTAENIEVGVKGQFMDRRFTMNAAAFINDKENAQQFTFVPAGTLNAVVVIDEVDITGVEFEFEASPSDSLLLTGGFAYVDAEVKRFDLDPTTVGNRAPFVPEVTGNFSLTHFWDLGDSLGSGGLTLVSNIRYEHRGSQFFEAANIPDWKRESLNLLDARIALESETGWTLSLWGKNLTDKVFAEDVVPVFADPAIRTAATFRSVPRTWGLEFTYEF